AVTLGERVHGPAHGGLAEQAVDDVVRARSGAGEQVAERAVAVLAYRAVEARDRARRLVRLLDVGHADPGGAGDLLVGGVTVELGREIGAHAGDAAVALQHVDRQAHRTRLAGDAPLDGLPDPPGGV